MERPLAVLPRVRTRLQRHGQDEPNSSANGRFRAAGIRRCAGEHAPCIPARSHRAASPAARARKERVQRTTCGATRVGHGPDAGDRGPARKTTHAGSDHPRYFRRRIQLRVSTIHTHRHADTRALWVRVRPSVAGGSGPQLRLRGEHAPPHRGAVFISPGGRKEANARPAIGESERQRSNRKRTIPAAERGRRRGSGGDAISALKECGFCSAPRTETPSHTMRGSLVLRRC